MHFFCFSDDPNESVAHAVAAELVILRIILSEDQFKGLNDPMEIADNGSMRAVVGDMIENKNKESNSIKILSDVLDLLTSSLLFYPL